MLRPPGPGPTLPLAHLLRFRRDPLGFVGRLTRKYGDIVFFRMGRQNVFILNHPDYIKDVLVTNDRKFKKGRILERAKVVLGEGLLTSEGDFHRRQRRLMQPAFHQKKIAEYGRDMVAYAARWRERWHDGQELDLHAEMMGLTLSIVGKVLFGANVEDQTHEVRVALDAIMEVFDFVLIPFSEILEKLPLPPVRRIMAANKRLDELVYGMIAEAKKSGKDRGDLLSMLLRAQDSENGGGRMTDRQLRDECITLILAGHETTANTLTWTWYLLSQNPQAERCLHAELDSVLGGRLPAPEDVERLRYTEMVLAESLRLYPPAWGVARKSLEEHAIGGYTLPKGALILMNQWVLHRDPRYYPDPEKFDPERWTPEAKASRPKFAYFPFGGGPRQCIGDGFAWMEGILLLATLAQQWRFRLAPGQKVAPKPVITLRPRYGMRMLAHRR